MGRVLVFFSVLLCVGVQASTEDLARNLFWSRPCAGLLSAFFETLPPVGRKRVALESTEASSIELLRRFLEERFPHRFEVDAIGPLLTDSQTFDRWTEQQTLINRLSGLRGAIGQRDTLVGIFDGEDRISAFLDRFHDKTVALARAGLDPVSLREKVLSSHLAKALIAMGVAVGAAQVATGRHAEWVWAVSSLMALRGLQLPFDYSWRLRRHRDGDAPEKAVLPGLFEKAYRITRSHPKAPEWLFWGIETRFSLNTLEEIWDQSPGDFINSNLAEALAWDDHVNTLPFWERWAARIKLARLQRQNKELEASVKLQVSGPEAYFDFLLLKAGTAGLTRPRLMVAFRLPPWANDGDGGSGGNDGVINSDPPPHAPHYYPTPVGSH